MTWRTISARPYIEVVDVFAMPQSGTGVSVEAVDPVFQTKMLDMLKQTGREEMVVGWYHSHPGFGQGLAGFARHVIHRILSPHVLNHTACYDGPAISAMP
jgi:proteasome lid subunit RPN8/RPN11